MSFLLYLLIYYTKSTRKRLGISQNSSLARNFHLKNIYSTNLRWITPLTQTWKRPIILSSLISLCKDERAPKFFHKFIDSLTQTHRLSQKFILTIDHTTLIVLSSFYAKISPYEFCKERVLVKKKKALHSLQRASKRKGAVALTFDISGASQDEKMEIFRWFFILKSQYLKIRMNVFVRSMN